MKTPQDRIRQMRRDIAKARDELARLDSMIAPAVVAISNAVGDGWTNTPANGVGYIDSDGTSDPIGAAIARASPVFELDSQLRLTWALLCETPNAVSMLLRKASNLPPRSSGPVVVSCGAGVHMAGYEVWGRKDPRGVLSRCDEIAEPNLGSLCLACGKRRQRWRAEQRESA